MDRSDVAVFGYGAVPSELDMIREGKILGTSDAERAAIPAKPGNVG